MHVSPSEVRLLHPPRRRPPFFPLEKPVWTGVTSPSTRAFPPISLCLGEYLYSVSACARAPGGQFWGFLAFSEPESLKTLPREPTSGVSSSFETYDAITLLAGKNSFPCSPRSTARQRDVLLLSAKSRDPTRRRKSLKPPKLARNLHESTIQASKRLESPRIGFLRLRSRQRARAASDAAPTRSA